MEGTTSATFDLPNGTTLIETATPGQNLSVSPSADSCSYQFVSTSGLTSCVTGLGSITYLEQSPLSNQGSLPTFQKLSTNEVVFIGGSTATNSAEKLFKLTQDGVLSTLATTGSITSAFTKFLIEDSDRIVLVGRTVNQESGDTAPFIKTLSAAGAETNVTLDTRTYSGSGISFLAKDYAGSAIIGLTNVGTSVGDVSTARIIAVDSSNSIVNLISVGSTSPTTHSIDTFCGGAAGNLLAFCDYGGTYVTSVHSTSDATYILARSSTNGSDSLPLRTILVQILPNLSVVDLSLISAPLYISGAGGDEIIVSGTDSEATKKIVKYNTATTSETVLATGVIAPLPFSFSTRNSTLVGYATTFPDMTTNIYQIPVTSSELGTPVSTEFPIAAGVIGSIRIAY